MGTIAYNEKAITTTYSNMLKDLKNNGFYDDEKKKNIPTFRMCGDIVLTPKMWEVMNSDFWLTDALVNSYIHAIQTMVPVNDNLTIHFSTDMSWINSIQRSRRYSKGFDIIELTRASELFYRKPFGLHILPTCDNTHWWMMVVDLTAKKIYSIDSMNSKRFDCALQVISIIRLGLTKKLESGVTKNTRSTRSTQNIEQKIDATIPTMDDWVYQQLPILDLFQQNDTYNCGVYLAAYITQLLTSDPNSFLNNEKYFSKSVIKNTKTSAFKFRRFMVAVLFEYIAKHGN